jgi:hypothetical protein
MVCVEICLRCESVSSPCSQAKVKLGPFVSPLFPTFICILCYLRALGLSPGVGVLGALCCLGMLGLHFDVVSTD